MTEIQRFLIDSADPKYRAFTLPLIPGIDEGSFLGVRLPVMKKYAKGLSPKQKEEFMRELPHRYHEENILHAFCLNEIKDFDEFIERADAFLPYVTNWSVCDSICNKHLSKHKEELLPVVYSWLKSDEVYRVRYAVKCLMNYYLGEDFKEEHLEKVRAIRPNDYYVEMMIAWYLATGLAKNFDPFVRVIEERWFSNSIHNKAIQKAVESYRVSDDHKLFLKMLKAK